jgi:hypothetical protein
MLAALVRASGRMNATAARFPRWGEVCLVVVGLQFMGRLERMAGPTRSRREKQLLRYTHWLNQCFG